MYLTKLDFGQFSLSHKFMRILITGCVIFNKQYKYSFVSSEISYGCDSDPADTRRNNNAIIMSKRWTESFRCNDDVIITACLTHWG